MSLGLSWTIGKWGWGRKGGWPGLGLGMLGLGGGGAYPAFMPMTSVRVVTQSLTSDGPSAMMTYVRWGVKISNRRDCRSKLNRGRLHKKRLRHYKNRNKDWPRN